MTSQVVDKSARTSSIEGRRSIHAGPRAFGADGAIQQARDCLTLRIADRRPERLSSRSVVCFPLMNGWSVPPRIGVRSPRSRSTGSTLSIIHTASSTYLSERF